MSFPTGRLPGPFGRGLVIAATVVAVVLAAMSALWPVEYERTGLLVGHPLAVPGADAVQGFFTVASNIAYFGFQLMFAVCLLARMLVADAAQSRQLWWRRSPLTYAGSPWARP